MEYREAKPEDLPILNQMYLEVIQYMQETGNGIWDEVYPLCMFGEDIQNHRMYAVTDRGRIVAAFALSDHHDGQLAVMWKDPEQTAVYLERLAVNVHEMKNGIGTAAISCAVKAAKQCGADTLRLFVVEDNQPAVRLYRKTGFQQAEGSFDEVIDETTTLHELGFEKNLLD